MLRIGIIGYGYWGPNLARNFAQVDGAELSCASDLRPENLAALARRYPGLHTSIDCRTLLDDPDVDAIVIATPVRSHFELAMLALSAGKHVFV
jgi:predicted dehydrogenase